MYGTQFWSLVEKNCNDLSDLLVGWASDQLVATVPVHGGVNPSVGYVQYACRVCQRVLILSHFLRECSGTICSTSMLSSALGWPLVVLRSSDNIRYPFSSVLSFDESVSLYRIKFLSRITCMYHSSLTASTCTFFQPVVSLQLLLPYGTAMWILNTQDFSWKKSIERTIKHSTTINS